MDRSLCWCRYLCCRVDRIDRYPDMIAVVVAGVVARLQLHARLHIASHRIALGCDDVVDL